MAKLIALREDIRNLLFDPLTPVTKSSFVLLLGFVKGYMPFSFYTISAEYNFIPCFLATMYLDFIAENVHLSELETVRTRIYKS